jgi:hypothetical protein
MAKRIQKKTATATPVFVAAPVEVYKPQTHVTEKYKTVLYNEAVAYWKENCAYYGSDGNRPPNVQKRMQAILGAVDLETAETALQKAKGTCLMSLLAAWCRNQIPGPDSWENWEKKAKNALSLSKMLEKKDNMPAARSQYIKYEEYLEKAEALKKKGLDKSK